MKPDMKQTAIALFTTSMLLTSPMMCDDVPLATASSTPPPPPTDNTGSQSLMSAAFGGNVQQGKISGVQPNALVSVSLFAMEEVKPRVFNEHDLVQIIVREASEAKSSQETETKRDYKMDGGVDAWPRFILEELAVARLMAGRSADLPQLKLDFKKESKGEGEYAREDEFTARLTAEVIEILPNGNLVLEARTYIKTDGEENTLKVTGICRPDDITPLNTVQSTQIHDLHVEKMHKGELKKASEKGAVAKLLDSIFAF